MDLYEQLLRTAYLHELAEEYQAYSATTNAVQFNGVSTASDTIHIDYAHETTTAATDDTNWYRQHCNRGNGYVEIKSRRKCKESEEDEPLEISEEMRRFIEELEKTKKTERGV